MEFKTEYETDWLGSDGRSYMRQFREGEVAEVSIERAESWAKRGVVAILEAQP